MNDAARLTEALAEIARLRAQLVALEAERAAVFGTLERPTHDEPATTITHNVPPSAPPHGK